MAETAELRHLCGYLFDAASLFAAFCEQYPVLMAVDEEIMQSRLALCAAFVRVLAAGLGRWRSGSWPHAAGEAAVARRAQPGDRRCRCEEVLRPGQK